MASNIVRVLWFSCLLGLYQSQKPSDHCQDPGKTYDVSDTGITLIDYTSLKADGSQFCVNMSHNRITTIKNDTFEKHWNLLTIDLSCNLISQLPPLRQRRLEYLNVSHNRLTSLSIDLFKGTTHLRVIDFSNNNLFDVPLNVFNYSFSQLSHIDFSHNSLMSFEPWNYVQEGVTNRDLDLRWNNISSFTNKGGLSIAEYARSTPYDLVSNDLRHNFIRQWDSNYILQYFATHISIDNALLCMLVDIRENPWMCDCYLYPAVKAISKSILKYSKHKFAIIKCADPPELRDKRIFYDLTLDDLVCNISQKCPEKCLCQEKPNEQVMSIDCRGQNLTEIPKVFPTSKYRDTKLYLDDNQIQRIDSIHISKQIVTLSMKNNRLDFINGSVIKDIATNDNARVDLSDNQLTVLPEEMNILKHERVALSGNSLECGCDMLWMTEWLKQPPKPKPQDVLTCNFKGTTYNIKDLNEDILECIEKSSVYLIVVLTGVLAVVIVLLITAKRCPYETKVLIYKIFRIHPADKYIVDKDADTAYDMYVSFDEEDPYLRQWVKRVLVRRLETRKPFYRLCLSMKHLPAGPEAEARLDLMEKSRRMLIILSEGYNNNKWCLYESSQSECLDHIDGRILYLLYDDRAADFAAEEPWKSRLKGRKCFKLSERMVWWKLRYELPVKSAAQR